MVHRILKTTVEIADALLTELKRPAAREHTTVRALIEEGIRAVLAARAGGRAFRLRDASVEGRGLAADSREGGWESVRAAAYEERGG